MIVLVRKWTMEAHRFVGLGCFLVGHLACQLHNLSWRQVFVSALISLKENLSFSTCPWKLAIAEASCYESDVPCFRFIFKPFVLVL